LRVVPPLQSGGRSWKYKKEFGLYFGIGARPQDQNIIIWPSSYGTDILGQKLFKRPNHHLRINLISRLGKFGRKGALYQVPEMTTEARCHCEPKAKQSIAPGELADMDCFGVTRLAMTRTMWVSLRETWYYTRGLSL
jgi:hypothetical protein